MRPRKISGSYVKSIDMLKTCGREKYCGQMSGFGFVMIYFLVFLVLIFIFPDSRRVIQKCRKIITGVVNFKFIFKIE